MKKKVLWGLLALAAVVIVILAIVLPKAESREKPVESGQVLASEKAEQEAEQPPAAEPEQEKEAALAQGELPLDDTPLKAGEKPADDSQESGSQPAEQEDPAPTVDPETGMELEEDELPIDTP